MMVVSAPWNVSVHADDVAFCLCRIEEEGKAARPDVSVLQTSDDVAGPGRVLPAGDPGSGKPSVSASIGLDQEALDAALRDAGAGTPGAHS